MDGKIQCNLEKSEHHMGVISSSKMTLGKDADGNHVGGASGVCCYTTEAATVLSASDDRRQDNDFPAVRVFCSGG